MILTQAILEKAIIKDCDRIIKKHQSILRYKYKKSRKWAKATGLIATPPRITTPKSWTNSGFNPYKVKSNVKYYAKEIYAAIVSGTYEPKTAIRFKISKAGGGKRQITVFSIYDRTIARLLNKELNQTNAYKFSPYSYAFQSNKTLNQAIEHLSSHIIATNRVYTCEFDFSSYFDNIEHKYILSILSKLFNVSSHDIQLIDSFLNFDYVDEDGKVKQNIKGIPQGLALSNFLSNVAGTELDREIEKVGAVYARYCDDTLIISDSYHKIHKCTLIFNEHCFKSGSLINLKKSGGVKILVPKAAGRQEIVTSHEVDFLGYKLTPHSIGIREDTVNKFKKSLQKTINKNLLERQLLSSFNPDRISKTSELDWDLLSTIYSIRYSIGDYVGNKKSHGFMRTFPLVNDIEQLKEMDGRLLDAVHSALVKRHHSLLLPAGVISRGTYSKENLVTGSWFDFKLVSTKFKVNPTMPSFVYAHRRAVSEFRNVNDRALFNYLSETVFDSIFHPTDDYDY